MQLTKNFSLKELTASDTASRFGIREQFLPDDRIVNNLKTLCTELLQPIRDEVGVLVVTSGYRCKRLNNIVSKEPNSTHLTGYAADIVVPDRRNRRLVTAIANLTKSRIIYPGKVILEYGTPSSPQWVHISYGNPAKNSWLKYDGVSYQNVDYRSFL